MLFASASAVISPNPWMMLPFALMLLSIALMPFIHPHWWERHYPKVAVALGAITVIYYAAFLKNTPRLYVVAHEYVSFIALIGALFIVTGGIHIRMKGSATPLINCLYLLVGAVLANLIGTTGASMLMIRPWIRMNKYRVTAFHIVFFIFIISNVGGCLTPIGDPPLFLGYLKGVPFWWVLEHCWAAWCVGVGALIALFFVFDFFNFRRAPGEIREEEADRDEWRFMGAHNIFFIALILVAVFLPAPWREILMIAAGTASYFLTRREIHEANHFNFHPIREVAWLFVGIFATMVPALDYLQLHATQFGLDSPMKFYWLTGALSGALDNAPTYLTFLATALGNQGLDLNSTTDILEFIRRDNHYLVAISLGAVFFGAMTYIGNGPNFMVKSISQQAKVHTPSFFGYLFLYAIPILLPIFWLVGYLFFSKNRLF